MYLVYDENGEKMRIFRRQEEAIQIVMSRPGWTYKKVKQKIIKRDGYSESILLGDALL